MRLATRDSTPKEPITGGLIQTPPTICPHCQMSTLAPTYNKQLADTILKAPKSLDDLTRDDDGRYPLYPEGEWVQKPLVVAGDGRTSISYKSIYGDDNHLTEAGKAAGADGK